MQHAVPATSPAAPVPERRPYGTWMMVTNKKKSVPVAKNHHQHKNNGNAAPKKGNQFEVLNDLQGAETQSMTPNNSEKGKSKTGTAQREKGKSPATNNPPLDRSTSSGFQPQNTTIPDSISTQNPPSRGRGGRQGEYRGKGRGSGRGLNTQAPQYPSIKPEPQTGMTIALLSPMLLRSSFFLKSSPTYANILRCGRCGFDFLSKRRNENLVDREQISALYEQIV
nr:LINE-type retrotransposon LIb DNA [Ipomoea batatas]